VTRNKLSLSLVIAVLLTIVAGCMPASSEQPATPVPTETQAVLVPTYTPTPVPTFTFTPTIVPTSTLPPTPSSTPESMSYTILLLEMEVKLASLDGSKTIVFKFAEATQAGDYSVTYTVNGEENPPLTLRAENGAYRLMEGLDIQPGMAEGIHPIISIWWWDTLWRWEKL